MGASYWLRSSNMGCTSRESCEKVTPMIAATYVGAIPHLKGKTALIKYVNDPWFASFDDKALTRSGSDGRCDPLDFVGYGWHRFDRDDFVVLRAKNDQS